MRMSEFIIREAISADLKAGQKEGVIREMVENLRLAGYFKGNESEDVVKAILKRELLSSTDLVHNNAKARVWMLQHRRFHPVVMSGDRVRALHQLEVDLVLVGVEFDRCFANPLV